ncbi:hypothetical protein [Streptomyces sp. SID3343]|uniref:hypothetical protein n=1 Tax=Streptomyces sp. SID3343 TaxID=2690260 RepID=UPI00136865B9|nr:hypothetical protein [Streptomyces sp. SID3343]MYV97394.1 hypothetical protein [Streptomyces sp. SID3343]
MEEQWRGIIDGSVSRESAHDWAARWVEAEDFDPADKRITTGLDYLHGFDLVVLEHGGWVHSASGSTGVLVKGRDEVAADLEHWLRENVLYDEDPVEFLARKRARALEFMKREE